MTIEERGSRDGLVSCGATDCALLIFLSHMYCDQSESIFNDLLHPLVMAELRHVHRYNCT